MTKISTQRKPLPYKGEIMSGKKITVPDQALSIRKILELYAKGIPAQGTINEPVYNEEFEHMSPKHYDLTEIDEQLQMYKQAQEDGKAILKDLEKKKKELLKPKDPPTPLTDE